MHPSVLKALQIYSAKGPVCLCKQPCRWEEGQWCGPQRKAYGAWSVLQSFDINIPPRVSTARNHALTGEGRSEFDEEFGLWKTSLTIKEV